MSSMTHDWTKENFPKKVWTRGSFEDYNELIKKLEVIDKKLGQPNCTSPEKFFEEIEKLLSRLENTIKTASTKKKKSTKRPKPKK